MPKRNTTWGATSILLALQHREGSRDVPFALYLRSCDCVGNVSGLRTFLCAARNRVIEPITYVLAGREI